MDQDTLQVMLREAVREGVASMLQTLMELDRAASRSEQCLAASLRERGGCKKGYYPHGFPRPKAVFKPVYLEGERQEERWAERRLKGFAKVREVLEKMLLERYAPRTQTLTHKS